MKLKRSVKIAAGAAALMLLGSCGQGPKEELTVLLRMMPAQQRYFKNEVLPAFEKEHNCKVHITTMNNVSDLPQMLGIDAGKPEPVISLVKVPFEMTRELAEDGLVQRLGDITSDGQVDMDMAQYHPVASALAMINRDYYYVPRKLETRVFFYRTSMVAEAYSKFDQYRETINTELKDLNGYGFPTNYTFEENPSEWDLFDLYTVGSIWGKEEYNGTTNGRIAHRGDRYNGTSQFMLDRAYQLGANQDDIRRMTGDAVEEMFFWEQAFVENGLYNSGIWEDPWRGSNIYNAIKDGKAFAAYLQQIDLFNVHGWPEDPGMPSYLDLETYPDDMGVALVPQGVSLSVDENGEPEIVGTRKITTGGWWWGVPTSSPKPELAYELSKFISNYENNAAESAQFGMIPVRKDLLSNISNVFNEGWVGQIYKVSLDQVSLQLADSVITLVPLDKEYPAISENYIDAWYDIAVGVAKGDREADLDEVQTVLKDVYNQKAREIFGERYPELAE